VEPDGCGLKTRHFRTDGAFYRLLSDALEAPRRREVGWLGRPRRTLRAAEVLLFRSYHGLRTRASRWGRKAEGTGSVEGASRRDGLRLHLGSGRKRLCGWVNVDRLLFRGVDVVADVTQGLCFAGVEAVFAEHFIEHLEADDALRLLAEIHRALRPGGWLRLSTPNLDWVWQNLYRIEETADRRRQMAIQLNRSFYGWGHRFLWNRELLAEALESSGFCDPRWCRYRETGVRLFSGIEQHEPEEEAGELSHVLIVEAQKGCPQPARLEALQRSLQRDLLRHVRRSDEAHGLLRRPMESDSDDAPAG
jgi:predicted SAM-dependent methyltransferase